MNRNGPCSTASWNYQLKNVTHLFVGGYWKPHKQPSLDAGSYSEPTLTTGKLHMTSSTPQSKMTFAFLLELSVRIFFFSNSFFLYLGCSLVEVKSIICILSPLFFFYCRIPSTYQVSWDQGKMGCTVGSGFQNNPIKPCFLSWLLLPRPRETWLSPKEN